MAHRHHCLRAVIEAFEPSTWAPLSTNSGRSVASEPRQHHCPRTVATQRCALPTSSHTSLSATRVSRALPHEQGTTRSSTGALSHSGSMTLPASSAHISRRVPCACRVLCPVSKAQHVAAQVHSGSMHARASLCPRASRRAMHDTSNPHSDRTASIGTQALVTRRSGNDSLRDMHYACARQLCSSTDQLQPNYKPRNTLWIITINHTQQ